MGGLDDRLQRLESRFMPSPRLRGRESIGRSCGE